MSDFIATQAAADATAAKYGVVQTGTAVDGSYHETVAHEGHTLADVAAEGGKITRLRMLTERGYPFLDVSYCHATLADGRTVAVQLPEGRLPRRNTKAALIEMAKREHVFAKGLGLLDEGNWSILFG
jgi:hypothetical protein